MATAGVLVEQAITTDTMLKTIGVILEETILLGITRIIKGKMTMDAIQLPEGTLAMGMTILLSRLLKSHLRQVVITVGRLLLPGITGTILNEEITMNTERGHLFLHLLREDTMLLKYQQPFLRVLMMLRRLCRPVTMLIVELIEGRLQPKDIRSTLEDRELHLVPLLEPASLSIGLPLGMSTSPA